MTEEIVDAINAIWIMTSTFVIFLMQTGFALLESGSCSAKNQVNLMMKNVLDVIIGGFIYWCVGYGLQYGNSDWSNPFCGIGDFFLYQSDYKKFLHFIFQLSFSSTTITIVSGATAERFNFYAYCIFCSTFCLIYCIPSGWIWRENGFLNTLGSLDCCGAAAVHFLGGIASLIAAIKLKPRLDRYANGWRTTAPKPDNAVNSIAGTMLLWWGFLFFNSGSSFGVTDGLWKNASRAFTVTLIASFSGGIFALIYSCLTLHYIDVSLVNNGILSAAVSICGPAFFIETYDSFYIGIIASLISCCLPLLLNRLKIDDPVGAIAVHAGGGFWGTIAVGLSADFDENVKASIDSTKSQRGLFKSGSFKLLGNQILALLAICVWTVLTAWLILTIINMFVSLRMSKEEEVFGADLWMHGLKTRDNSRGHTEKIVNLKLNAAKISKRLRRVGYESSEKNDNTIAVSTINLNSEFTSSV